MNVEVITEEFEQAMADYAVAVGKTLSQVIREQAKLLTLDLMKKTPPMEGAKIGNTTVQKKAGENAVERDIGKVFADLGNAKWEDKSLSKMWRAGNFEGVKKALNDHPNKAELPIFRYQYFIDKPAKSIHKKARSSGGRGGVWKNWKTKVAIYTKNERAKYIREVKKHVGTSKSSWLATLVALKGKAPAWINRHGTKNGSYLDATKLKDNPFFTIKANAVNMSFVNGYNDSLARRLKLFRKQAAIEIEIQNRKRFKK